MHEFVGIKNDIMLNKRSKNQPIIDSQCSHRIVKLGSRQDCGQSAIMCRKECQKRMNMTHWQNQHEFYSVQELKSYISQKTQELNGDVYTLKAKIIQIFQQSEKFLRNLKQTYNSELDFIIKQAINHQNTQFVRNSMQKLQDQRNELLSCRQVYCLKKFHPKISRQNHQIIQKIQNKIYVQMCKTLDFLHKKQNIFCNNTLFQTINDFSNQQQKDQKNIEKTQSLLNLSNYIKSTKTNPDKDKIIVKKTNQGMNEKKAFFHWGPIQQQACQKTTQNIGYKISTDKNRTERQLTLPSNIQQNQRDQSSSRQYQKYQEKTLVYHNQMQNQIQEENVIQFKFMEIQDQIISSSNTQEGGQNNKQLKQEMNPFYKMCCDYKQFQSIDKLFNLRDNISIKQNFKENNSPIIQSSIRPNKQSPFYNSAKNQNNSIFNRIKRKGNQNLQADSLNTHSQGRKVVKPDNLDSFVIGDSKKQFNQKRLQQRSKLSHHSLFDNYDKQDMKFERNIINVMIPEVIIKQKQLIKNLQKQKSGKKFTVQFLNKVQIQNKNKNNIQKYKFQTTDQHQLTYNLNKQKKIKCIQQEGNNKKNKKKQENTEQKLFLQQNWDKKQQIKEKNTEKNPFLNKPSQIQNIFNNRLLNNDEQKGKSNFSQLIIHGNKYAQNSLEKSADKKIINPLKNSLSFGKVTPRESFQQLSKKIFQQQERKKKQSVQKEKEMNKNSLHNQLPANQQSGFLTNNVDQDQQKQLYQRYQDKKGQSKSQRQNQQNIKKQQKQQIRMFLNKQIKGLNRNLNFNNSQYKNQIPKFLKQRQR